MFFIISKLNSCCEKLLLPETKKEPRNIEIPIMKGAKGATLIWEKMNDKNLLSLKIAAKEIAKTVWNPQNGDKPIKIPREIESALVLLLPSLSRMFSLKNRLKPFLRKYR